jgi:alpha-beta hydrolase superfamily lysophospholipase
MRKKKYPGIFLWLLLILLLILNGIAYLHAYRFTHFAEANPAAVAFPKTTDLRTLSPGQMAKALLTGVPLPRPENKQTPTLPYTEVRLQGQKTLGAWYLPVQNPKGTVALFHGYGGDKSRMLSKAEAFVQLGYNALLVDFMGSGTSEGNSTSIGFWEAEQVKTAYRYLLEQDAEPIYLFGTSMGAVAIMKAMQDYPLEPAGLILESPFGSMQRAVENRFRIVGAPAFPMAHLLLFWGGLQQGFNAYAHNPTAYARSISTPTLLLYGEQDDRVDREEIDEILANLQGEKALRTYPQAGHENYLIKYREEWTRDVEAFLRLTGQEDRL